MLIIVVATINKVNNDKAFFQLCTDDGLPVQVCQRCSRLVNLSYKFKLQCESSDTILRQYQKSHEVQVNMNRALK